MQGEIVVGMAAMGTQLAGFLALALVILSRDSRGVALGKHTLVLSLLGLGVLTVLSAGWNFSSSLTCGLTAAMLVVGFISHPASLPQTEVNPFVPARTHATHMVV